MSPLPCHILTDQKDHEMKTKYLIIEDVKELRDNLAKELRLSTSEETEILVTGSGEDALAILKQNPDTDLVVLDLTLETDMHGMEVLKEIKKFSQVPVVVMTTDDTPERQTAATDAGAVGYIIKDQFPREIQIKHYLEAVLKRERSRTATTPDRYQFEGWTLDVRQRRVFNSDGGEVRLTEGEKELLITFVESPGKVLEQDKLIKKLGMDEGEDPRAAIAQLLSRLRRKIDKGRQTSFIKNVHGQGFYFTAAVTPLSKA